MFDVAGINATALRVLREKDGYQLNDLADRVGISVQYLCDIEAGRRRLKRSPALIKRLADALNVPLSMLQEGEAA